MGRGFGPGVGVPGPSMSDGSGGVGVGSMVTGCPKLARLAEDEDDGEGDLKRTFFSVPGVVQSRVEEGLHVTSERRLLGMPETEDNGESLFTLLQQRVCAQHASGGKHLLFEDRGSSPPAHLPASSRGWASGALGAECATRPRHNTTAGRLSYPSRYLPASSVMHTRIRLFSQ